MSIIINNNNRRNRENATLVVSTTAYTHTNSIRLNSKDERISLPFCRSAGFSERDKIQTRKEERELFERARAFSLSLSLLPSRNQWKTRSKKRPRRTPHKSAALRKNTKGTMHHRSSRLKRETKKKSNELFKNTNAQLQRSSFLQRLSVPRSTSTRASRWGSGPARTGRRLCRCWQPCAN